MSEIDWAHERELEKAKAAPPGTVVCPTCGNPFATGETIAERLRLIMACRKLNTRELVAGLSVKGTSYANVRRFVSGTGEPALKILVDMASVLNVRVEWLTYGSGQVR